MEKRLKVKPTVIRGIIQHDGVVWVGTTLEFGLAAQGSSPQEVKRLLHSQLVSYVDEACNIDRAHAEQLLSRKAPLAVYARYYAALLRLALKNLNNKNNNRAQLYSEAMPSQFAHCN